MSLIPTLIPFQGQPQGKHSLPFLPFQTNPLRGFNTMMKDSILMEIDEFLWNNMIFCPNDQGQVIDQRRKNAMVLKQNHKGEWWVSPVFIRWLNNNLSLKGDKRFDETAKSLQSCTYELLNELLAYLKFAKHDLVIS